MTEEIPEWAQGTNDAIHAFPGQPGVELPDAAMLQQFVQNIIEGVIRQVVLKLVGVLLPGPAGQQLADWAVGLVGDVSTLFGALDGINLSDPGSVLKAVTSIGGTLVQQIVDALTSGLTGSSTTGNDPLALLLGVLGQAEKLPGNLLALLTGHKAKQSSLQAQTNAALTGGFVHDFAKGVTGWTNLPGYALAKSSRGPFVQPSSVTVAYRSSGLSVDAYGVHLDVNPTMQGLCWVGLCATTTASNWAGLMMYRGFDGDALWLVTGASPTLWAVQKSVSFTGDNRLSGITGLDLTTDGVSTFSVLCNGDPVPELVDIDLGSIVTHGSSNRGVIVGANGFDRGDDGFWGPAPMKVASYVA